MRATVCHTNSMNVRMNSHLQTRDGITSTCASLALMEAMAGHTARSEFAFTGVATAVAGTTGVRCRAA